MYMMNDVSQVRKDLSQLIGSKVMLQSGKGRQKPDKSQGTIENVYPAVFTIALESEGPKRTVSYSYTDVLTRTIELTLLD